MSLELFWRCSALRVLYFCIAFKDIDGPCLEIELPVREGMNMCSCYFLFRVAKFCIWQLNIGCCTHGWIWRVTANRSLVPNFKLPHFQAASNEVKHHTLPPKNCKFLIVFLFQKPSDPNGRAVPNQASRSKLSQWWINRRRCSSWQTSRSCASTDVCMLNSRRASKLRPASVWRHSRCVWRVQSLQESALRHSTSANCVLPKKMWEVYIISFVILDFCFRKAISQITLQFFCFEDNPASWCCR